MIWSSKQSPEDVVVVNTNTPASPTSGEQPSDTTLVTGDAAMSGHMMNTAGAETFTIMTNETLGWKAGKPTGAHTGTVNVKDGELLVKDDQIIGGEFTFDMTSLQMLDTNNPRLLSEIKEKFFETTKYPESKFVLHSVTESGNEYMVNGDLTIKDVTKAISFPATIDMNGNTISAKATFAVDKTTWNLHHWDNIMNKYLQFMIDMTLTK